MKLLLDTHVWLWILLDAGGLGERAAEAVTDPSNELWLSPVSIWESHMLIEKGQVDVKAEPALWLRHALTVFPVRDAPLTAEVALASRGLALSHQDPADRFIAATALVAELTLVTRDTKLLAAAGYECLAA